MEYLITSLFRSFQFELARITSGIPFGFCVDSRIPLRHPFHRFFPVYLGMYSHPGLVSKAVSIPRFGFTLCSSLYMRSLSHTRQPSITPIVPLHTFHRIATRLQLTIITV